MILIDSYGWLEYFLEGPLADKYAKYVEEANEDNYVIPTVVVYEVFKRYAVFRESRALLKPIFNLPPARV